MDKPKHSLLTGSFSALQAQFTVKPAEVTESKPSRATPISIVREAIYSVTKTSRFLMMGQKL